MAIEGGLTGIDGLRGLEPGLGSGRGTVTVGTPGGRGAGGSVPREGSVRTLEGLVEGLATF